MIQDFNFNTNTNNFAAMKEEIQDLRVIHDFRAIRIACHLETDSSLDQMIQEKPDSASRLSKFFSKLAEFDLFEMSSIVLTGI